MQAIFHLAGRNTKLFFRDKTLCFMSVLAVFIVIILYVVFLQNLQINAIENVIGDTTSIHVLVNEWMVAGLLSIVPVTTTLGAYSIMISDRETKKINDLLITRAKRAHIQFGYIIQSSIIGLMLTLLAFILSEIFIVLSGGHILNLPDILTVIGLIFLMVVMASSFNLVLCFFINSQSAFSTLNTIVGTGIGFLCGVYVPMGQLPLVVQKLIIFFPLSHPAVLLRQIFMDSTMADIFKGASDSVLADYKINFAIIYEWNDVVIPSFISLAFICLTIFICIIFSLILFKQRNK